MSKIKSKDDEVLEFAKQREFWKSHPIEFLTNVLGIDIPPHQKKLIKECVKRNKISVKSANSIGKSFCISAIAYWWFFTHVSLDPKVNCICLITAPTFSQVKMSIFANLRNFANIAEQYIKKRFGEEYSFLPKSFSESANVCEYWFDEKSFIAGIASGEGAGGAGNTLSGRHGTYVLAICDEAIAISEGTYSSLKGILQSGKETKQILLGNTTLPNGASGTFYNSFQEGSDFYQMSITAFDTPNFTERSEERR